MRLRTSLALAAVVACDLSCVAPRPAPPRADKYEDLIALFADWRAFQRPRLIDGVPDYTPAAMAAQQQALAGWQRRLAAMDTSGWTVAQQVDREVVAAEMNGLDFDHRVLRPWERDPSFYVTVFDEQSDQPAREGPQAAGSVELWKLTFPLTHEQAATLSAALLPIPALLTQARGNLIGNARDLWVYGINDLKGQRARLAALLGRVAGHAELSIAINRAGEATDRYIDWLQEEAPKKTGPSGVGVANYDWYLAHVQLLPYTWADEVALMERELARARASLALEEQKNRGQPELVPVASPDEHGRRFNAAVSEYISFWKQRDLLTLRDWMEPALRARIGQFAPGDQREFFTEVDYRDPVMLRTHGYHWIDLAWMEHEPNPSPIRRGPLLYNIFDSRTEGFATAMEELMMQEGLFDARPRSRELVYILIAQRAARALGDLKMHANQATLEQAAKFASDNTPRGWLRLKGQTVWFEQHLYLQQPAYGTSYLIGKMEVDKLIAARAGQLGERFTLKQFMDELNSVGLIPISLVRWQLTGARPGK